MNEKAGCGDCAPLFPACLGGFPLAGGDKRFSGGTFLSLYRILELESQEPITHRPSPLEIAPLPKTPKNPSTEHSKLSRLVILGERGGTRKKTRTGPLVQVCKGAGGPSSFLCSPDPDTLFRIVLCVGSRKPLCGVLNSGWSWGPIIRKDVGV